MAGIRAIKKRLEAVDVKEIVQVAITSNVKELEQLQKLQMLTGKDSTGGILGKYKNKEYAAKKFALNPLAGFGNMDFRLTGDFYKEFFTRVGTNSVFINSNNNKTERLMKINSKAFGLTKENASEFSIQHVRPTGNRLFKKQMTGV